MRRALTALVLAALAAAAVACDGGSGLRDVSDGGAPSPSAPSGALGWTGCGRTECATLVVPIDHDVPDGPTIDLAVLRVLARRPAQRIGSLVLNPGGPGGSGVDMARFARDWLPEELLDRFDIVGFDPRGVGQSTAVDCVDNLDPFFSADTSPDNASEIRTLAAAAEQLAVACGRATAPPGLLAHLSTVDTARDLELLREALGDDQLTFLGFSYGTLLGAVYADRFPDRVRAMVLDGAVNPASTFEESARVQAIGFERALDLFLDDCAARRGCDFGDGDPSGAFDALLARVDRSGIAAPDDRDKRRLTSTLFDLGVANSLYDGESGWGDLEAALDEAENGDGSTLLSLADDYLDRQPGGRYGELQEQFWSIACLDVAAPRDLTTVVAIAGRVAAVAPRFGASTLYLGLPCVYWPVVAAEPVPASVRAAGAAPIVVVGSTDDPATPFSEAQALAASLESGRLVVFEDSRHTAFPSGSPCLDDVIVDYLVKLRAPHADLRCRP